MKAIILAGGKGERLRPLSYKIPKPMIQIAGKPVLEHIVTFFKKQNICDFIFALCYLPNITEQYFGNGANFDVKIQYTYENPSQPLGTAGAITLGKQYIKDTFIVAYGDILRKLNISKMIQEHKKQKALATVNVYKHTTAYPKSSIAFTKNNQMTRFDERPDIQKLKKDFTWTNGSFYIFEPEIFNYIPTDHSSDFGKDIFPQLISSNKSVYVFPSEDYFIDIGDFRKLEQARKTISLI